jgi:putative ABC transport system permease protein
VVSTAAGTGLASIPAGVTLHRGVLPVMGHAVQTALPVAVLDVYQAPELVLLALSGPAIARRVALQCLARLAGPATRGEVGQRIFAAGVHSGIAGSKHQ